MKTKLPTSNVILLGGTPFCRGVVDLLHRSGIGVVVVDRNETIALSCELHIRSDVLDVPYIMSKLKEYQVPKILGAYAAADISITTANLLNASFTGHSVPENVLPTITSKHAMIEKWDKAGLLNRKTTAYQTFENSIVAFNQQYKTIIKPNNSSSSRGITILAANAGAQPLRTAFATAQQMGSDGKVLVEEFVEGTELTIEMLGDNFGNVSVYGISVKYHTENTINNKIAVKLHYNAVTLSDEELRRIAEYGIACYRAFGLRNSFGHLEILRRPDGSLVPVEINSRSAGFVGSPLVDVTSGRTYVLDYLRVLTGERIPSGLLQTENAAMYFFYDLPAQVTAKVETDIMRHLDPRIKSLYHNRSRLRAGDRYELLTCDNDRYGFEVLVGDRHVFKIEELLNAEKNFLKEFFGQS